MHRRPDWKLWIWWTLFAAPAAAQTWDAPDALALRERSAARRVEDAGAAARGWSGTANGIIRWYVQTGPDALRLTDRPATTDLVRVQVYGRGGAGSKQVIEQWTRERSLPTDITYHRDHLGIVTSGYGDAIRLGDGDEVRDVPHPLAPGADSHYEVALGDSLTVRAPDGELRVQQLLVRPRIPAEMAVLGILDLDVATGALVRFAFSFTPAAYRDPTVEGITVSLEQSRAARGIWLPYRQSIEIRRRAAQVDLPLRTVIRADWKIDAELSEQIASTFLGPTIDGLRRPTPGPLPVQVAPPADDAALRRQIELGVDRRLSDARQAARFGVSGVSHVLSFDRVQGPAIGGGFVTRVGTLGLSSAAGVGVSEGRVIGDVALAGPLGQGEWSLALSRRVREFADVPVISGALNSVRTLLAADDAGDWALVSALQLHWRRPLQPGQPGLRFSIGVEDADGLVAQAATLGGQLRPNPSLGTGTFGVLRAAMLCGPITAEAEAGTGPHTYGRIALRAEIERTAGPGRLQLRLNAGVATRGTPDRRGFALGGRGTLVGERYRAYDGFGVVAARVTWLAEVRVPEVRLRGPVTTGPRLRIGPFVGAGGTWRELPSLTGTTSDGWRPVAGLVAEPFWRLIRVEAGVPLRGPHAGRPRLVLDVHPDWWPLL